jgi:ribose transport system substrate-binding protein
MNKALIFLRDYWKCLTGHPLVLPGKLQVALCGLFISLLSQQPLCAATDTKVAMVSGGPHPYTASWTRAASDAARDFRLGSAGYKMPPRLDPGEQIALLESLKRQGYNAYVLFPYDTPETLKTIADLAANGATIVAAAGCMKDPSPAQFCLATDSSISAYTGAKELINAMTGKKRIAHFTGWMTDPNTQTRINEVQRAAKEGGAEVVQVIADIDEPVVAAEKIGAYLSAHAKDIDGIITTAWVPAVETTNQLRRIGDKRIKMVGIDHDEVVLKGIKDGFVTGSMLQNPYGQAYIGAFALDRLRHGCKIKSTAPWKSNARTSRLIDSGSVYVDARRVDQYVDAMQDLTKSLVSNFESTYLECHK